MILAAVFTLSMNVLFAGNDGAPMNSESISFQASLAPVTPAAATFEDVNDVPASAFMLAPLTPADADFSDTAAEEIIDISALAPVAPVDADFDSTDAQAVNVSALAPVTPAVADFSDGI